MTVNTLLKSMIIMDHRSGAKFKDGSGGEDHYTLTVDLNGHGTLMNAKVEKLYIQRGMLFLVAKGKK